MSVFRSTAVWTANSTVQVWLDSAGTIPAAVSTYPTDVVISGNKVPTNASGTLQVFQVDGKIAVYLGAPGSTTVLNASDLNPVNLNAYVVNSATTTTATANGGDVVEVNTTTAAVTITLANSVAGTTIRVWRDSAGSNNVTVTPANGTIKGAASATLGAQWASATFIALAGGGWAQF